MNKNFAIQLICVSIFFLNEEVNCGYFDWLPGYSIPLMESEICYGDFGCFPRFPKSNFFPGMLPSGPNEINVRYLLFTCQNRYRPFIFDQNITEEKLLKTSFNPKFKTIFLVHGFRDLYDEMDWMGDLKDFILRDTSKINFNYCQNNVIGVDWRNGSQIALYTQSMANTMVVGRGIAFIIQKLQNLYKSNENSFAVVGHSLGSHISGFAGKEYQKIFSGRKLRFILGLDPAGPGFTEIDENFHLNPSDAQMVVTIHTNGGPVVTDNFGIVQPLGHYSFFPNGGEQQPGCEKTQAISEILLKGLATGITDTVACSHRRATRLAQFNSTLYTSAESVGVACSNYANFNEGKCGNCGENNSLCHYFGKWFTFWIEQTVPKSWTKPVSLYLNTAAKSPWALHLYQIVVHTADQKMQTGKLKITPIGVLRDQNPVTIDINEILTQNQTYHTLLSFPKEVGKIERMSLEFFNNAVSDDDKSDIIFDSVEFNYLSKIDPLERQELSSKIKVTQPLLGNKALFFDLN